MRVGNGSEKKKPVIKTLVCASVNSNLKVNRMNTIFNGCYFFISYSSNYISSFVQLPARASYLLANFELFFFVIVFKFFSVMFKLLNTNAFKVIEFSIVYPLLEVVHLPTYCKINLSVSFLSDLNILNAVLALNLNGYFKRLVLRSFSISVILCFYDSI